VARFRSLEEFFLDGEPSIEGQIHDGWAQTPLIGRELEATVLVARPRMVPGRAAHLGAAETLALLNKFFSWVGSEPLQQSRGVVAECSGTRLSAVFSVEFGSVDAFGEALQVARDLVQQDLEFAPRVGLATGEVIVGYLGTPLNYSCTAVGRPVDLAGICAGCEPQPGIPESNATVITFPEADWRDREFEVAFAPKRWREPDGSRGEWDFPWRLEDAREIEVHESQPLLVRQVVASLLGPDAYAATPEEQVRGAVEHLRDQAT
jgi:class 3 adenylate cyclase